MKECSLYVHIPYCASKCIYCDFFSGGVGKADWKRYSKALINELEERKGELINCPDTLYIGGGTPSLMPPIEFKFLISSIQNITGNKGVWDEFTLEVNPDDVTDEKCVMWKNIGVNRVSMGIQSLIDDELKKIRRRHSSKTALAAYNLLRKNFSNISIDLMFGIPHQTLDSWKETVKKILSLRPEHISAYSLMLEEGTPLTALHDAGKIILPKDTECEAMWQYLSNELKKVGYDQYEISNYSLPGHRSKHNSRYWSNFPYLGIGPSAHSYDGYRIRRANPCNLYGYIKRFSSDKDKNKLNDSNVEHFYTEEVLSIEELIEERILTRMRVKEGINLNMFRKDFGEQNFQRLMTNAMPLIDRGMIKIEDIYMSLTPQGIMVSNQVMLQLSL